MKTSRRLGIAITAAALIGLSTGPAWAEPATTVSYASNASATLFSGLAFDTCTAPTLATMTAWRSSPFGAVGIYMGGVNRTCQQPELTASWVTQVTGLGWRLLPIYKGLQPPCGGKSTDQKIVLSSATTQGRAAADDAVTKAGALGLLGGSAIYNDIENYSTTDGVCRSAVLRYASGWTKRLHEKGFVSGIYVNLSSGAKDLNTYYLSTSYARPDAIWIARYDGVASLTGWSGISDSRWALHQRAKQFLANRSETYGGVTVNIDRDLLDAPVATVPYGHRVTSSTPLSGRSAPSASAPVVTSYPSGSSVKIVCQTPGTAVGTTKVWDKLSNGTYVTDYYVDTASKSTYSPPIARCTYPYQITDPDGVTARTGPGTSYTSNGKIPTGALAYVTCQRAGTTVGSTSIWDKLIDGRWVTDAYVASPSSSTYSAPVPRC